MKPLSTFRKEFVENNAISHEIVPSSLVFNRYLPIIFTFVTFVKQCVKRFACRLGGGKGWVSGRRLLYRVSKNEAAGQAELARGLGFIHVSLLIFSLRPSLI